jgi:hypothetical protein
MNLDRFYNKPTPVLDLFMQIIEEIRWNYSDFQKESYYIQLSKVDKNITAINEIKSFATWLEMGKFQYYERYGLASIMIRPSEPVEKDEIVTCFSGHYYGFRAYVTQSGADIRMYKAGEFMKEKQPTPPFTFEEWHKAWGGLSSELESAKPKKAV